MSDLAIPDEVVRMNLAAYGEAGRAWLEALPKVVQELRARWELTIGPPFEGGCVGLVVPAERVDGNRVVLKVSFIDEETRHEADALALWDGDGAVLLLDSDPERGALLLERIEPGTFLGDHPDGTRRSRSHAGYSDGCGDRFPSLTRFRPFEDWHNDGPSSCPSVSTNCACPSRSPCSERPRACAANSPALCGSRSWRTATTTSGTSWRRSANPGS